MTTTENTTETGQPEQTAAEAVETVLPMLDLPELLEAALARAVDSQLDGIARGIAKDALKDMLTPDVLTGMAEAARHRIEVTLNPPLVGDEEVTGADEGEEEAEPEQQRETFYANVVDFVENYVAHIYRREVAGQTTPKVKWCPEWWLHGEVKARFHALWMAFETLRMGTKLEQSLFWINHFDPMMDRILSTEGPFKHCSARTGHQPIYNILPTLPAPAAVAGVGVEGGGDSGDGWTETASKIWVPRGYDTERPPREVRGFPE